MVTARDKLPSRRACISQRVSIDGQTVHYAIGLYPDGRPGELFIEVAKAGAALRTWASETGMLLSVALQHGTPLETLTDLFIGTRAFPCGAVEGHPCINKCLSIMDLIARDMAITFLQRTDLADVEEIEAPLIITRKNDAPSR
jgi:ribonucleoside-diphosphate reductase alpha chain